MWWHTKSSVQTAVENFHGEHARFPNRELMVLEDDVNMYARYFQEHLERTFYTRVEMERIGSTVDGTCVKVPLEFDLFFYVPFDDQTRVIDVIGHPDFFFINVNRGQRLLADNFSMKFYNCVEEARKKNRYLNKYGKIEERGVTSMLLTVCEDDEVKFQLDLIPGVRVKSYDTHSYYVPRRFLSRRGFKCAWLETNSLSELDMLRQYSISDPELMCIRILKSLRDSDEGLGALQSSTIKNVVMKQLHRGDWGLGKLGARVLRSLQALESGFATGSIIKYRSADFNLLESYSRDQINRIHERLGELVRYQHLFTYSLE